MSTWKSSQAVLPALRCRSGLTAAGPPATATAFDVPARGSSAQTSRSGVSRKLLIKEFVRLFDAEKCDSRLDRRRDRWGRGQEGGMTLPDDD